jgi:hypothetical protein
MAGKTSAKADPWGTSGGNPMTGGKGTGGSYASGGTGSVTAGKRAAGVPNILDILDRQRQAIQAGISEGSQHGLGAGLGTGFNTLVHGASQDSQDVSRENVRKALGSNLSQGDRDYVWTSPNGNKLPVGAIREGIDDFALDTVTDPVTLETLGFGPLAKILGRGGKALYDASKLGKNSVVKAGTEVAQDAMTYGGSAKRELGEPRFNQAIAADNRQAYRADMAKYLLQKRLAAARALPQTKDEHLRVLRALNGEEQLTDPVTGKLIVEPHVKAAYDAMDSLRNDAAALQSNETGLRKLAYGGGKLANRNLADRVEPWDLSYVKPGAANRTFDSPDAPKLLMKMEHPDDIQPGRGGPRRIVGRVDRQYELPEELREFQSPTDQGIMGSDNIRRDYLTAPHPDETSTGRKAGSFNLLHPHAPNLIQRDEFKIDGDEDPNKYYDAFSRMLDNAATQGTAGRMRDELGVARSFNAPRDEPLSQLFERTSRATGDQRSNPEILADAWRNVINIPKNAVTVLGGKHAFFNVPDLARNAEGSGAAIQALMKGAKYATMSPEERYEALRDAHEGGVIAPFDERGNPIVDLLSKTPRGVRAAGGSVVGGYNGYQEDAKHDPNASPLERLESTLAGAGVGAAGGLAAPNMARGMNRLTWAIDDAAKQAVYQRKIARGMDPDEAAAETLRQMIDYRHKSAFTKAASNVLPFASFRTKLPTAIASGGAKVPLRLLTADRATQGLSSQGKVDVDGHQVSVKPPTADVLGIGDDGGMEYARASMSDPLRAILSFAGGYEKHYDPDTRTTTLRFKPRYTTYGQPLLPHRDEDGKWKAGFLGSQAANYIPASIGQSLLQGPGLNEFPDEDPLSELLGGATGLRVR